MCKVQYKRESGVMLLEAIVGILIMGILGTGLTYVFVKMVKTQRDNNALILVSNRMKQDVSMNGISSTCPSNGNSSFTQQVTVGNQNFSETITCSIQSFNVNVNGTSVAVSVPKIQYVYSSQSGMLGQKYPFVVGN